MTVVFLDTVGLIAVWDRSDQWHAGADAAYRELLGTNRELVTTPQVLYECGNSAARRPYRTMVTQLRNELLRQDRVVVPSRGDEQAAWHAYERGEAGNAGIVDHLSFAVMRRLGAAEAFTNDRHFAAAGFRVLF